MAAVIPSVNTVFRLDPLKTALKSFECPTLRAISIKSGSLTKTPSAGSRQSFHCPRHELLFWRCGGLRHHSGTPAAGAPSAQAAGGCWFFLPSWSGDFQHPRFKSSGTARAASHLSWYLNLPAPGFNQARSFASLASKTKCHSRL